MEFTDRQVHTISNCLRVAAEKFREHAQVCRTTEPNEMFRGPALERLAQQFDLQQRQAEELAHMLDMGSDNFVLSAVPKGMRRREGVEYGCGDYECDQCYAHVSARRAAVDADTAKDEDSKRSTFGNGLGEVCATCWSTHVACLDCGGPVCACDGHECTTARGTNA